MRRAWHIAAVASVLVGCGGEPEPAAGSGDRAPSDGVGGGVGAAIEEFTGARTKVVWVQQQKDGGLDQHAAGKNHKLMVLDTADGRGERALLPEVGSYSRPLFTPDGGRVVFSTKGATKDARGVRSYRPKCFVVGVDGSGLRELGAGYAEDVWRDPSDGTLWVYAGVGFKDADSVVMEAGRLERFRLDAPGGREVVWDRTAVGNEGFSVSRDGRRMVGLYPWPDAGVVDLESGQLRRTGNGCWTSMAPDDSGATWVFDGAHRNATFYGAGGGELGTLALNAHPDLEGHKVYHPRWSNHARFAVMTGPYLENKKAGANGVEIYMVRFAADLGTIEASAKVTANGRADLFPDVWIEGGEGASLVLGGGVAVAAGADGDWPPLRDGLVWAWRDTRENVEVGGAVCRVRAEGAARYGRRFDLAPGWGRFVAEGLEQERFAGDRRHALEARLTPGAGDGVVFTAGSSVLEQREGRWVFSSDAGTGLGMALEFGTLQAGVPVNVFVRWGKGEIDAALDGREVESSAAVGVDPEARGGSGLWFGGDGWDGRVERVMVFRDTVPEDAPSGALGGAPPAAPERVRARLRLVERTVDPEPEELGAYRRALVALLYEVAEVENGTLEAPRVAVAHWALMDREPVAGDALRIGEELVLEIDPWAEHPQLKSERLFNTLSDFDAPLFFDPRTPKLKTTER